MVFNDAEMETIVYDILVDCRSVTPALERNEIAQHAVNHLATEIHKHVSAALQRLVAKGLVCDDRDRAQGQPIRYRLAQGKTPQH